MTGSPQKKNHVPVLGVFAAECLNIASAHGINVANLLGDFGLSRDTNRLASQFIDLEQLQEVMRALWAQLPNPNLGFETGLRIPPTALGAVGAAFISAPNLGAGLTIIQKYWSLMGRGVTLTHHLIGDQSVVTFRPERKLDTFFSRWMVEAGMGAFWRTLQAMLPGTHQEISVYLNRNEPLLLESSTPIGLMAIHGRPFDQIVFPAALLNMPFMLHSQSGLQAALRHCETSLVVHGEAAPLANRVRAMLGMAEVGFPSLNAAADILLMSPRTFRRKLSESSNSYAKLLQEARMLRAVQLLRDPALSISDIAGQLGYRDDANFGRAFRRWTNSSPTDARKLFNGSQGTSGSDSFGEQQ